MTEKPFTHKKAYANVKLNFIFQEEAAKLILKVLNKKGILNLGGPSKTVYNFAKKSNPNVKKIKAKNVTKVQYKKNMSMSINKLLTILKKNKKLLIN